MTFFPGNYNLYIMMKKIITDAKYPPLVDMRNGLSKYYIMFAIIVFIVALIIKKRDKSKSITLGICVSLVFVLGFILSEASIVDDSEHDNFTGEEVYSFVSGQLGDIEAFNDIVKGNKVFKEREESDLVSIQLSPNFTTHRDLIERNAIMYRLPFEFTKGTIFGKLRTEIDIPVQSEDYFNCIIDYTLNSGGKIVRADGKVNDYFYYKGEKFTTRERAKKYIDELGLSTDEYQNISEASGYYGDLTIKVPKDGLIRSETQLNEYILGYTLYTRKNQVFCKIRM